MTKRYVDNDLNRRLGRVGMVIGTAVHHRETDTVSYKTYVDNPKNRALGRVGLPRGSAPEPRAFDETYCTNLDTPRKTSSAKHGVEFATAGQKSESGFGSSSSSCDSDSTVNRSQNRHAAKVERKQKRETAEQPKTASAVGPRVPKSGLKTYVDNALNRSLGRVGLEHGTAVHHKEESSSSKIYVDNEFNRRHNKVDQPLESVPIPRKDRRYTDIPLNRQLGRVGLPWCTSTEKPHAELLSRLKTVNFEDDIPDDVIEIYEKDTAAKETIEKFLEMTDREVWIRKWLKESNYAHRDARQRTSKKVIESDRGTIINCKELKLIQKIGQGDFGGVHVAKWKDDQLVAVKRFRIKSMSQKRLLEFEREIAIICELDHPNIVQFFGACNELPHLTIVMEYMDLSLHEALHIKMVDFLENERISIMRDIAEGLKYLHVMQIAHCDLKPANVLLNNVQGEGISDPEFPVNAKLTDFVLSVFKSRSEATASAAVCDSIIGTPRYSAPEVLRGELLSVDQRKKSDVYSFGLTVVELLLEETPFEDLRPDQLREQVGKRGMKPVMKHWPIMTSEVRTWLDRCWNGKVKERPDSQELASFSRRTNKIFC